MSTTANSTVTNKVKVAIIGCGERGINAYAAKISTLSDKMEIVALADPDKNKLQRAVNTLNVSNDICFSSGEDFLAQDKMADAVFICTQDRQHVTQAITALKKGYHILLEKPISPDASECRELVKEAKKYGKHVIVCHVLRYTEFYRIIKNIISAKTIGDVVSIKAIENVGYWHQTHSFVRGAWRKSEETSPMILAKCCHDMDILVWLAGKKCKKASSFGSIKIFKKEMAPKGASLRCLDGCKIKKTCPYDAEKIYIDSPRTGLANGNTSWLANVLAIKPTKENMVQALKEGRYGRCVYHCDNTVVDNQVVNLLMEDDITISFTMCAFTEECFREIKIMGSMGEIIGNMDTNIIEVHVFNGENQIIDLIRDPTDVSGHGGGDLGIVKDFLDLLLLEEQSSTDMSSVEQSVESHYIALAAEESRLKGGDVINIEDYR